MHLPSAVLLKKILDAFEGRRDLILTPFGPQSGKGAVSKTTPIPRGKRLN